MSGTAQPHPTRQVARVGAVPTLGAIKPFGMSYLAATPFVCHICKTTNA